MLSVATTKGKSSFQDCLVFLLYYFIHDPCTSNNSDKICTFSVGDKDVSCDQITDMAVSPSKHFTKK